MSRNARGTRGRRGNGYGARSVAAMLPLNAAARLASAAGRGPSAGGSSVALFETLEHRTLMAAQPIAADSSMAYDAAGNLHVAYHDANGDDLKYTRQSPAGTWTAPVTIDAAGADTGRMVSLAVDANGHVGVAYYDAANADLKYAYNDGTKWSPVTVDGKGVVGRNPSLAFDAKNVPVISYYRPDSGDLRLATLKNAKKNAWTISTIAKKGDVGVFSSVAIDPATNKPTVAFTGADGKVQVATKKNGAFAPVLIDDLAAAAGSVNVAIGTDGKPAVSYVDPTTGSIKLASPTAAKKATYFAETVAEVPAGSNAHPTLIIDPATGAKQVVYYDASANGVFVAKKVAGSAVQTTQLKAGGGAGFIAAAQPGNGSISYAVVDTTTPGGSGVGAIDLGNAATTPVAPTAVAAAATGPTTIDVAWTDNAPNETGFVVERAAAGEDFAVVAQLPVNAASYTDATALEGRTYRYRVAATGSDGTKVYGTAAGSAATPAVVVVTVTTPPAAPSDLAVASASAEQVELSWVDHSASETGFEIQRASSGAGLWQVVATVGANATSFVDAAVAENAGYSYRVYAKLGSLTSQLTNVAAATTKPTAPTGLTAVDVTTDSVSLSWQNPSAKATGFVLERSADGVAFAPLATLDADTTDYADNDVAEGTVYYYRVKAQGLVDSDYSATANATTAPLAPSNLSAIAASTTEIGLSWTDHSDRETGYAVQRSTAGGAFLTVATLAPNVTGYTDAGRAEGVSYSYRVQATLAGGASSGFSATVGTQTLPSAPTGTQANLTDAGAHVAINWVDHATGESGYQVQRQVAASGPTDFEPQVIPTNPWTTIATTAGNTSGYLDQAAAEGTTYYYRVRAVNPSGTSAFDTTVSATTVSAVPTGLTVTTAGKDALDLSWTDQSAGEAGFVIQRKAAGDADFATVGTTHIDVTTYTDTELDAATTYTYRVYAFNAGGNSATTAEASGATLTEAPAHVTATAASDAQIDLAWDPTDGATGYVVERSTDGIAWAPVGGDLTANAYSDAVGEAETFRYRVLAVNAGGTSEASTVATGTSLPAAPTDLAVATDSATSLTLTWVDHSAGETGYVVERKDGGETEFTEAATLGADVATFQDAGLDPTTVYTYRVHAVNAGGDSVATEDVDGTTLTLAPVNLTATAVSDVQIDLAWDATDGATGYLVERSVDGIAWSDLGDSVSPTYSDEVGEAETYQYRVRAANAGGVSDPSTAATGSSLPAAPTDVAAAADSPTSLTVTWVDQSAGEIGYAIERSTDGGAHFSPLAPVAADAETYADTTCAEGTEYVYRVTAIGAGGPSASAASDPTVTPPVAPDGLVASSSDASSVHLVWVDHSAAEDGFIVERSSSVDPDWASIATPGEDAESFDDTTAVAGIDYSYRVSAHTAGVPSDASNTANGETLAVAPTAVAAAALSDASVQIDWVGSDGSDGYVIERSEGSGGLWADVGTITDPAVTTYTDTMSVTESTEYVYRVRGTNTAGDGPESDPTTVTTKPSAPADLAAAAATPTSVGLTWTDASQTEDGYVVERSTDAGDHWVGLTVTPADATSYTDLTAPESATADYRVRATAGGIESVDVTPATATTPVAVPDAVAAVATSDAAVHLAWVPVSTVATAQRIERSTDLGGHWVAVTTIPNGTASTYDDAGLAQDTEYDYRVVALVGAAESGPSSDSATTTALSTPAGLTATSPTATSVELHWTNVSGTAADVLIERNDGGGSWLPLTSVAGNVATYIDTSVAEGLAYQYRVTAERPGNASTASAPASVTTIPAAPTAVTATAFSDVRIDLAWGDASTHETGYTVERSDDAGAHWSTLVSNLGINATAYADTTGVENGTYAYRVSANSPAGASELAVSNPATTLPTGPSDLEATPASTTSIDLVWLDHSNAETGFHVQRRLAGSNGAWSDLGDAAANATTYTDSTAAESTAYEYQVTATVGGRSSAASNTSVATTLPTALTGLAVTGTTASNVDLSWTNTSNAPSVVIERSDNGGIDWVMINMVGQGATAYSDGALPEGTSYVYRVRAYNGDGGFGGYSADVPATTLAVAPVGTTASFTGPMNVQLDWADASSKETGYAVERRLVGDPTWTPLTTLLAGTTTYDDGAVDEINGDLEYRVGAVNAAGVASFGDVATALVVP